MAADRFVTWKGESVPPTQEEVEWFLEDYFGMVATVDWNQDQHRFYVTFPGPTTNAFRRVWVDPSTQNHEPRERWIEVILGDNNIDVLTRQQDQFTSDVANNLQHWFAKFWEGEAEEE